MTKMSLAAAQALENGQSKSESTLYKEGNGYLNDIRLESFGHLLADYVLQGATFTINDVDKNKITIGEGIISFGDQLWRSFTSDFRANKENTTYYVGFVINQGYVFGPTEPTEKYMRLWSVSTDLAGVLGSPVDYRGAIGKVKYKAIYDGVYLNTGEVQAAIDNAIAATTDVTNVLADANTALTNANTTLDKSVVALTNSETALSNADQATTNATTAITDANTAINTANTAITNVNAARVLTETATTNANQATENTNLAITNAQNATAATNTAISQANEATTNANTAASSVNTAKDNAITATTNANTAATAANTARDNAITATTNANTATTNANTARTNADTATTNANAATNTINAILPNVEGLEHKGTYNSGTQYFLNNLVLSGGSTWQALQNSIGQALPIPPAKSNAYWTLLAEKGVDGTGSVVTVNNVSPTGEGNVTLTPADIGAVAMVAGKQLSTEDYTTTEKTKLGTLNNYVHPTTAGNKHIPTGGAANQILRYSASGTAVWGAVNGSEVVQSATHRLVSDTEKTTWNGKETTTGSQAKATQALTDAKAYTDQEILNLGDVGGSLEGYATVEDFGAIGDGIADDTLAFSRAINESPEGTKFILSKTYLVNNVRNDGGTASRKNLTFIGHGTEATVKIKPNITATIQHGTLTGLTYQVKDFYEELATSALGWTVARLQAHTGRIFEYIKVPVSTTIPSSLKVGAVLRGTISGLQFQVSGIDTNNPDGAGTARIYFLGGANNISTQNRLETDIDGLTFIENLQVKPYLKRDVWLLDFGATALPAVFLPSRKITQTVSGKVARIDKTYAYTAQGATIKNIVEVSSFLPSQIGKPYDQPIVPLNNNENLKVEEFSLGSMSFASFNKTENVLIENITFDGSCYEVGAFRMDANDWNIIYTHAVRNLTIRDCTFKNAVMAGIHVGGTSNANAAYTDFSDKVLIDNCTFVNNGRNDIEIIYSKNIQITNCKGDHTLDIEMNGDEIAENITISGCNFREFTPYSPSPVSSTSEISVSNCSFNRVSSQIGAVAKISNCYIHSIGIYNANAIELTGCTINMINGMYGNSVPTFNNCQIYGLPTIGAASLNEGDKSTLRLNNSVIDLSFSQSGSHGSWAFDFRDSVVISRTREIVITKIYASTEDSVFHNVTFNNVALETGPEVNPMKFYNCQFLLKDIAVLKVALRGWSTTSKIHLQNCYLQASMYQDASATFIDCVLDGISKPKLSALQGITINGLKSTLPQGIDWAYLEVPGAGFKLKFNHVCVSKTIPSPLGVYGGATTSNVEEGSTALYMNDTTKFSSVVTYNATTLVVKDVKNGDFRIESRTTDPTTPEIGQIWFRSDL